MPSRCFSQSLGVLKRWSRRLMRWNPRPPADLPRPNCGLALLATCLFLLGSLELFFFVHSSRGRDFTNYMQPPYREKVRNYDVGERWQPLDNRSVADALRQKVRVHCLLLVRDERQRRKAEHIARTWGARCNRLHIRDDDVNARQVYEQIYESHYLSLDWLLHADVDSYVIVENLRYLLAGRPSSRPLYFSAEHLAYPYAHVGLRSTTDYVLSRGALRLLLVSACSSGLEQCLAGTGPGESRQLFPFAVHAALLPFTLRNEFWNWPYLYQAAYEGFNSCSAQPVSWPYVRANQLHVLDYVLYHLRVYGVVQALPALAAVQLDAQPGDTIVAQQLRRQVRILCLVLTYPKQHARVWRPISETWGRRCNKLLFFSSREQRVADGSTIALNVSEGYGQLWGKTKAAFRYVYEHHFDEADWFFKADDDTYAVIENMRYMLHGRSPKEPIYFGCRFKPFVDQGYMSGGAGYVLSREALRRLVEHGLNRSHGEGCNHEQRGSEDFEMGVCLEHCNVTAGDSRDQLGRHRFLPLQLEEFLIPGKLEQSNWLWDFMYYRHEEGLACCSNYAITVHYVLAYEMYVLDFLLFKMRPYGIINMHEPLAMTTNDP